MPICLSYLVYVEAIPQGSRPQRSTLTVGLVPCCMTATGLLSCTDPHSSRVVDTVFSVDSIASQASQETVSLHDQSTIAFYSVFGRLQRL